MRKISTGSYRGEARSTTSRFRRDRVHPGSADPMQHELHNALEIYQATRPMPNIQMR